MMLTCFILIYLMVAVLFERYAASHAKDLFAILLVAVIFNNAVIANIAYYYMNRTYFASLSTAIEMEYTIQSLETDTKKIAVIGKFNEKFALDTVSNVNQIHMLGQLLEKNLLTDAYHLVYFLNETFYQEYEKVNLMLKAESELVQQINEMECWPDHDGIRLIDDVIVIKLMDLSAEDFVP